MWAPCGLCWTTKGTWVKNNTEIMAVPGGTAPAVVGGPHLTVSWKAPGSSTWRRLDDATARAILAACAAEQATFLLKKTVRRPWESPDPETLVVATSGLDRIVASNAACTICWGFSSTCTFDRLPNTAPTLAAMVAECEAAKRRQVLSELLEYVTTEERIKSFLSKVDVSNPAGGGYPLAKNARISRLAANARARPGSALYERFLDAMEGHVSDLGGALQSLMGSPSQDLTPLTFAFHGTPLANVPSILTDGMLPEKRVKGGDWFATSPWTSVAYCQKFSSGPPPYRIIVFLLLPVSSAVHRGSAGIIVMSNERYELPLGTFDLDFDVQIPEYG